MKNMTLTFLASLTFLFFSCNNDLKKSDDIFFKAQKLFSEKQRPEGQKDVIELTCDPIDTVRIGIIGLGMRGYWAPIRLSQIENVEIKALCDLEFKWNQREKLKKMLPLADLYSEKEDWKKVCEREDIDLIYICTNWSNHTPMAVYAMEHGKHVAVEVPAALTVEECWQLVNTAEKTQKHCIQLENCNYDFFETTTLNMAQKGIFGEIVHAEGAYIHDLRELNFSNEGYWNMWRLKQLEKSDGNTYPTHGLGPICHTMNIHRGDKMNYIVSMSSNQFGMTEYAKEKFGENSDFAKKNYKKGDINTSLIKTEKGKTIMLQHDVTSPRPYSRLHTISGTKGFAQKYPKKGIALSPNSHQFLSQNKLDSVLNKHKHPIVEEIEKKAREVGGHGGMDYIMDYRIIYCLRNGLPMDMDVYDAAEWSSIIELSRISVNNQSMPIKIPDFTRGSWNKINKVTYYNNK